MSRINVFPGTFLEPAFLHLGENRSRDCGRSSLPPAVQSDASFSYSDSLHEVSAYPSGAFTLLNPFLLS